MGRENVVSANHEKQNGGVQFDESGIISHDHKHTPDGLGQRLSRRISTGYSIRVTSDSSMRHRLRARKRLFYERSRVCDYCVVFALAGVALAVIESELVASQLRIGKVGSTIFFLSYYYFCRF